MREITYRASATDAADVDVELANVLDIGLATSEQASTAAADDFLLLTEQWGRVRRGRTIANRPRASAGLVFGSTTLGMSDDVATTPRFVGGGSSQPIGDVVLWGHEDHLVRGLPASGPSWEQIAAVDFCYRDEGARAFVFSRPALEGVLSESQLALRAAFGPGPVRVELELLTHPSDESPLESIVAWVTCDMPVEEGLDRLEEFDDAWTASLAPELLRLINFNVEFR